MTDMQKFIELYKSLGISLVAEKAGDYWQNKFPGAACTITLDEETHPKTAVGYAGMFTVVTFDKDGKFINQGFWE